MQCIIAHKANNAHHSLSALIILNNLESQVNEILIVILIKIMDPKDYMLLVGCIGLSQQILEELQIFFANLDRNRCSTPLSGKHRHRNCCRRFAQVDCCRCDCENDSHFHTSHSMRPIRSTRSSHHRLAHKWQLFNLHPGSFFIYAVCTNIQFFFATSLIINSHCAFSCIFLFLRATKLQLKLCSFILIYLFSCFDLPLAFLTYSLQYSCRIFEFHQRAEIGSYFSNTFRISGSIPQVLPPGGAYALLKRL